MTLAAYRLARSNAGWLRALADGLGSVLRRLNIRGKGRVANLLGSRLARRCPETTVSVAPGYGLRVPLADRIGRLMWVGAYEPDLRTLLSSFLQPGMVFLDVGAHIGYFSVLGAARVGPQGEVHAFEANPACVKRLRKNSERYPAIRVHAQAVSDAGGHALFFPSVRAAESGWGSLLQGGERAAAVAVPATTLDAWFCTRGVPRVDFIKLDIEGGEYRALLGATQLLRLMRPVISLEVNEVCLARDGRTPQDLFSLLTSFGYSVRGVLDRRSGEQVSALAVPQEKSGLWERFARLRLPWAPA